MTSTDSLKKLLMKPTRLEYFIRNIDDPDWFDFLQKEFSLFTHIPEPSLSADGKQIYFERWWPGQYLIKVSDKIPDKIAAILKGIKTDNHLVVRDFMDAILKMPSSISRTLIPTIDKWLDAKYKSLIDHDSVELLKKYVREKEYDSAIELFNVLSKVVPGRDGRGSLRYEIYTFRELKDQALPELLKVKAHDVLLIAEKRLKEAIAFEKGESKTDFSTIWRKAIEPHEQNWDHDDIKDILTDVVRDALGALEKIDAAKHRTVIQRFLKEDYSIFQRLAFYALSESAGNEDLIKGILKDETWLYGDHDLKHEFYFLVKKKLNILPTEDRNKFYEQILQGPPRTFYKKASDEKFAELRLYPIRDTLSALEPALKERPDLLKRLQELEEELGKAEYPDIDGPHSSWTGPTSPSNKEEISKMTVDEFLDYIRNKFKPKKDDWGPSPSPEGLSRIFEEVVQDNPEPWALAANRFFEPDKIYPAYVAGLLSGFEKACRTKKTFSLDAILGLCESLTEAIKSEAQLNSETVRERFDFGTFAWTCGAAANLLEAIVREESFSISVAEMGRIKTILFRLISLDPNPTEEDEKKYGSDKDFVTYCINCNRGKETRALLQYALRWARTFRSPKEIEAEKGKGPFPKGPSRIEPDVRQFLNDRFDVEKSPSVQSSFGYFLPFLYYLDQEWVKELLKTGKLFPKARERELFCKAHWVGFLFYSRFYEELFELLKTEYTAAVDSLDPKKQERHERSNQYRYRLGEHLMMAYYYYRDRCKSDDLLEQFFKRADEDARAHAIGFLGDIFKADEEAKNPEGRLRKWPLLKTIWEKRQSVKDYEATAYVRWLDLVPEPISSVETLIRSIIPFLYRGYQEEKLLEYLDKNIETHTLESMRLLVELLKSKESLINIHFRLDLIRQILEKAGSKRGKLPVAPLIDMAVNRLGEMGYYEFKDLLVRS